MRNNNAAEQSLLGACMLSAEAVAAAIAAGIHAGHFAGTEHQAIWQTIHELFIDGAAVDIITVSDKCSQSELAYIGKLAKDTPGSANVASYITAVKESYRRRKFYQLSQEAGQLAMTNAADEDLETIATKFLDVANDEHKTLHSMKSMITSFLDHTDEEAPDLPVLFEPLHKATGGFAPGDLVVIAGRPSHGKTSLMMECAESAAKTGCALVFSLETTEMQLMGRMVATSNAPVNKIRSRQLDGVAWTDITDRLGQLANLDLWIDDDTDVTAGKVFAEATMLQQRSGKPLAFVGIDYLQLMSGEGKNQNEKIEKITRTLKKTAKRLGVPLFLLSQLNRKVEERQPPRPTSSDLRGSGSIEQDADIIIMVYRPQVYDDTLETSIGELIITKNKNGRPRKVYCSYDGPTTRWRAAEREEVQEYLHYNISPAAATRHKRKGEM